MYAWPGHKTIGSWLFAFVVCASLSSNAAEPTNRAAKIYKSVRTKKISVEEGKRQCIALIGSPTNLPQKLEAAETLVKLSHGDDPLDRSAADTERRLANYRTAISATLPLLDRLDQAHKQSLPALSLGMELAKIIPEIVSTTKNTTEVLALSSKPLAYSEAILDANEKLLVPEDKILAEDEDLALEKEWAKKQLQQLKKQAALKIIYCCHAKDDAYYFKSRANIDRIMKKYPDNRDIQRIGAKRLKELADRLTRNTQVEIKTIH